MKKPCSQLDNSSSSRYLLFTPGPVSVEENVRTAIGKEGIGHREADFDNLLQSIEEKLLQLFAIKNTKEYKAVVIT
jgi:2-aminoethylphosphonate-pyruvate transaminase